MIMVGPYMYHSGDCIPEPCMFCHEKVLSDPITIPVEGYDRSNLVHAKCLDKQVCQRCGHHGSFLLVREREIGTLNETHKDFDLCHARLDCHSDICSFCDEGIADFPWIPKNSIKFHSACVSEMLRLHDFVGTEDNDRRRQRIPPSSLRSEDLWRLQPNYREESFAYSE